MGPVVNVGSMVTSAIITAASPFIMAGVGYVAQQTPIVTRKVRGYVQSAKRKE